MTEVIYAIQGAIAVVLGFWAYNRFTKRWTSALGDDVVSGYINDVGYVAGEGRFRYRILWIFSSWQAVFWLVCAALEAFSRL